MRFNNNYEIPIAKYGELSFTSSTGLHERYLLSNAGAAEQFAIAWAAFRAAIPSGNPPAIPPLNNTSLSRYPGGEENTNEQRPVWHPGGEPVPKPKMTSAGIFIMTILGIFGLIGAVSIISTKIGPVTPSELAPRPTPTVPILPPTDDGKLKRGIVLLKEIHQSYLGSDLDGFRRKIAASERELVAISQSIKAGEPRRDLLVNSTLAYQQASLRTSKDEECDALVAVGGIRRALLERVLDGKLTRSQRKVL